MSDLLSEKSEAQYDGRWSAMKLLEEAG